MCKIPLVLWIANAAACFSGRHGAVTRQAQQHQCRRHAVHNNAHQVQQAIQVEHSENSSRERLLCENERLLQENGQLWDWLYQTIQFPRLKQQEFGVWATAMGVSLNQIVDLLALILGTEADPGRSTVSCWAQAAAAAAGKVFQCLDQRCKGLVTTACLDEIFFPGRPVLVGVEPASMAVFLTAKSDRLNRRAWTDRLLAQDALRHLVQSRKAFTFLDRLHAELGRLSIDQELRRALVRLLWLRRRGRGGDDDGHHAQAILVQEVVCWRLAPTGGGGTARSGPLPLPAAGTRSAELRLHGTDPRRTV
ncbi:MAG TPA: hypothetical protein VJY33_10475 [Isosphaeraceae bacterium]|nr:hypothetical protein [Isosphaeraceae bacterium]